jgi:hypothetical protein
VHKSDNSANTDNAACAAGRRVSMVDINGFPIGLMMGMAQKADAVEAYSRLTEAEKERVLNECRDAKSKAEMDSIIDRLCGRWI